jgi:hypothetical protein
MFLLGCIPVRIGLSYLIKYVNKGKNKFLNVLKYLLAIFLLIISISFFIIYIFGLRKTGLETQGQPIWWDSLRPLHGLLYGIAAIFLLTQYNYRKVTPSRLIFWDAIFGLISFSIYHIFYIKK